MLSALSIIFVLVVAYEYTRNSNRGVFLYLLLAFFAPYISLGSLTFRSELIAAPLLLCILLVKKRKDTVIVYPFLLWILYVIYCISVSFLIKVEPFKGAVNYISIFNYFRFGALILLGANVELTSTTLVNWKKYIFLASIPIFLLALGVIFQISIANWLTSSFFTSPTRNVYESQLVSLDLGYSFRSIGVFENVSYYASYILLVIAIGFSFLLMGDKSPIKRNWVFFGLFMNFLAGISTSSMTFYVGFIIVVFYYFLKRPAHALKSISVLVVFVVSLLIIFWDKVQAFFTVYYDVFNYLASSFLEGNKLSERYSLSNRDTGNLSIIFKDTWIFGNGFRYYDNFVVNDSLYLEFYYQGGVVGSFIIISFVFLIFYYAVKSKEVKEHKIYLVFGVLLLAGVGCNSFTIVRLSEWIWILIGIISLVLHRQEISSKQKLII